MVETVLFTTQSRTHIANTLSTDRRTDGRTDRCKRRIYRSRCVYSRTTAAPAVTAVDHSDLSCPSLACRPRLYRSRFTVDSPLRSACVCLSAHISQKPHVHTLCIILNNAIYTCGHVSVLFRPQRITLCTSGFVDDVMFSRTQVQ